jgi:hypothetical protein
MVPYSSVKGVIFFSSISSSAKSFLYFSHDWPVALGFRGVSFGTTNGRGYDVYEPYWRRLDYWRGVEARGSGWARSIRGENRKGINALLEDLKSLNRVERMKSRRRCNCCFVDVEARRQSY